MLCVRVGDVDHVILPIAEQHMPRQLKYAIQGEKQFRMTSAMVYGEKKAMIRTSIGLPLRFTQSAPVLTSKVEIWSPIAASGITTRQSAELQLPIEVHVQVEKEQLKITTKLPQQKHTLLTVHTLPATYTVDAPEKREHHEQTPEQTELQASWSLFEKVSAGKLELKDFLRETKFDDIYSLEEAGSMELNNQNDRKHRLNNFIDSYKHNIMMSAKTIGGCRQHQISMEINGQCEPRMTYCKMDLKADANRDWQMAAQLQSLLPQTVQTVEQL
ncbi:hypothetical protein AAVH_29175 [Aphelenchoides avenae]|nr:hypothetical protein AAVH_29175 [Aphelenchus avenae]